MESEQRTGEPEHISGIMERLGIRRRDENDIAYPCANHRDVGIHNGEGCWKCREERETALDVYNRKQAIWKQNVPEFFREFDLDRAPNRASAEKVLAWQFNPRGIIAHGDTGTGKTFAMYALIKNLIRENIRVRCLTEYDFSLGVAEAQSKFELPHFVQSFYFNGVLFIDELGQVKLSEQAEASLMDVIDKRIGRKLPTLFTSNYTGVALENRFEPNRAKPVVRRIREFSEAIHF